MRLLSGCLFSGLMLLSGSLALASPPRHIKFRPVSLHISNMVHSKIPLPHAPGVVVLMYHHISPKENSMDVLPAHFAAQMQYLHDNGFHVISSAELVHAIQTRHPLPAKSIVLTFDDGWSSQVYAMGVLDQYHFPATFALITMFLDRPHRAYISILNVHHYAADDFLYVNHSHSHELRDFYRHPDKDVPLSVQEIRRFGTPFVPFYVYPYGLFTPRLRSDIRQAGYVAAFGVWDMPVDVRTVDIYNINRFLVTDKAVSFSEFVKIVNKSD